MNLLQKFLRWCPGAAGLVLRQKIYPQFFKSCGDGVLFGRFLDITQANQISIGNHVVLNNRASLKVDPNDLAGSAIVIDDNVFVGEGTSLKSLGNTLTLRSGTSLSSYCQVTSSAALTIGKKVLVASYCIIGDENQSGRDNQNIKTTTIGNGCWLGTRTKVRTGVTIGEETIIGAHSLVNKSLPEWAVCFGQPAMKYTDRKRKNQKTKI